MKPLEFEIWYKEGSRPPFIVGNNYHPVNAEILTEPPDSSVKSGYHLVVRSGLPKQAEPSPVFPVFPRTLRDLDNLRTGLSTYRTGKVVGQLLTEGRATNEQCQHLLQHLSRLAAEVEKLLPVIHQILDDKLRPADEAVAGQK